MENKVELPILSQKPGVIIKIVADEETIAEFFVILLRDLGALPRVLLVISQDKDQRRIVYAFIKFETLEELEKRLNTLEKILKGIPDISWDIIPFGEYGAYYVPEDVIEFYIKGIDEPLAMLSLSRYVRTFELMYKGMGRGSYVVSGMYGKENGRWIAEKHEKAARTLIEEERIRDLVELLLKALSHLKNVPKCEVTQEGKTIKVIFKKDKYFKNIMPLIVRYVYGLLSGLFEALGYKTLTEVDILHMKGIKELRIEIRNEIWTISISIEE